MEDLLVSLSATAREGAAMDGVLQLATLVLKRITVCKYDVAFVYLKTL